MGQSTLLSLSENNALASDDCLLTRTFGKDDEMVCQPVNLIRHNVWLNSGHTGDLKFEYGYFVLKGF